MRHIRWPVAVAAALLLCGGSVQAAREGIDSAGALLVLGGVLVGAWLVMANKGGDD